MPFMPFADWKPDLGALNSGALVRADGVLPLAAGYGPWRSFVAYSQGLAGSPLGGTISRKLNGERNVWAGTETNLYRLNRLTLGWETMGSGYAASSLERWNFVQFGSNLIAHQANNVPQVIDVDATGSPTFAPLGGSPPSMRYGAVVKEFVVFGNAIGDPNLIHWSGSNSPDFWTPGTDQSDIQRFPEGGPVTGIIGGETGFVFQEEAVRRLTYVGPPVIFEISKIADKRGCKAPFSMVRAGDTVFYLSPEGFAAISIQGESKLIDLGAWSEFFAADADALFVSRTRGVIDPLRSRVYWLYRSVNALEHYDTVLCWDYGINKATLCRVLLSEAVQAATVGLTLDTMDHLGPIDLMEVSLDDDSLKGDVPQFAGFNCDYVGGVDAPRLGFFSGLNQEAILETADMEFALGRRSFVAGVRPQIDAPVSMVSLGTRTLPNAEKVYTGETTPEGSTGICPFRSDSRYHSVRLRVPAQVLGEAGWTRTTGFEPFAKPSGHR
jgi:hypothetical protein